MTGAESASVHDFDKELFFEGCLPVEVIGSRGPETLRFGPMKPVGLHDPRTGPRPFAVVQLRQDNLAASHYSIVGFQTQLKWSEQKRVFRLVPGLENAEFVRFGMIHRNTYVNAPTDPRADASRPASRPGLFFAGQMSGVEGYVESAASGLVAGIGAARRALGNEPMAFPEDTALGALGRYIARSDPENYQPTNIAFGLLPELPARIKDKARKRMAMAHRALDSLERFRRLPGRRRSVPRFGAPPPPPSGSPCARPWTRSFATWPTSETPRPTPAAPMPAISPSSSSTSADELGREARPRDVDHLLIRSFLARLHRQGLKKVSAARKLASPRTFFRYLEPGGRARAQPRPGAALPAPRAEDSAAARRSRGRRPRRGPRRGPRRPCGPGPSSSCSTPPAFAARSS